MMRRGCRNSPARINEDHRMELSGVRVQKEDPDILFLTETKMDRGGIEGLRWRLGFTNMVVKDCKGKSGGLAIFWRNGVNF